MKEDIEKARRAARLREWRKRHPGKTRDYAADKRKRERDEGERLRFVCAKCGGEYIVPDSLGEQSQRKRAFVILGGRKVCEVCARSRFPRRRDPWGVDPRSCQ
jgi:hypothetical protein